jgi:hypothetical protein
MTDRDDDDRPMLLCGLCLARGKQRAATCGPKKLYCERCWFECGGDPVMEMFDQAVRAPDARLN